MLIIFDLDGTLTDSAPGILNGVRYAFEKMGNESEVDIRYVGPPLLTSFMEYAHMTKEEAERGVYLYREYYNADNGYTVALFELDYKKTPKSIVGTKNKLIGKTINAL